MNDADPRAVLERHGAILRGHFELTSGRHSDVYVQKARVLEDPRATLELARVVASWHERVDVVLAPALGAIAWGFAVALAAGARSIFAERVDGRMTLRRGFALHPEERCLVVEDVVTTGGSAAETYELARAAGTQALGVAALVDRSSGPLLFPLRSLARVEAASWGAADCPLCARGVPIDSPGSRRVASPD